MKKPDLRGANKTQPLENQRIARLSGLSQSEARLKKPFSVDLKELAKDKERNFKERLEFIDAYVEWLKKTPNKVWSKQQKSALG